MTPEEMTALVAAVTEAIGPKLNESINAAVTSHTKRIAKDFDTRLEGLTKATPPADPAPDPVTKGKVSPEQAAMQAKLDEYMAKFTEADSKRSAAEQATRDNIAYTRLKAALKDVRPDMVDIAAERLMHIQKRISYDEHGEPLFKTKRSPLPGMAEEDVEMTLESGVEYWLKTKDASPFVAAPAAVPGAGRGGRSPLGVPTGRTQAGMPKYDAPATTDEEKTARASERERAIQAVIGKANI